MPSSKLQSRRAYHLQELQIACSPDDPRRVVPEIPAGCGRILDAGCGAGQTLMALERNPDQHFCCGIDIDSEALLLGKSLCSEIEFVCSTAEEIPFRSGSFDLLICRTSLQYMDICAALREFHRVLDQKGSLWLVLHPFGKIRRRLTTSIRRGNLKEAAFQTYALTNGTLFAMLRRQYRFRLEPIGGRCTTRARVFETSCGETDLPILPFRRAGILW